MKQLELYIHIPFCVQKCKYCDFLSAPSTEKERTAYIKKLCEEIELYRGWASDYLVTSVFIGGGTPTVLSEELLKMLLGKLKEVFTTEPGAEFTMEMNPGTVTERKLKILKDCGVNRLSIGLQSTDDSELLRLGRIHSYEDFLKTYRMARACGFKNINVDLMSAIPFQTRKKWMDTLQKVLTLTPPPEHISAYSLIIEEGTPFFEQYGDGKNEQELPDEDTERAMYEDTKEILGRHGYHRYEISNYAKSGYECRHNLGYWERKEYLGLGLGASSLIGHERWSNIRDLADYLRIDFSKEREEIADLLRESKEMLSLQNEMEEFMFLGLRKIQGVSLREFEMYFRKSMREIYGDVIRRFCEEGLLEMEEGRIRLTDRGLDVSNYVMSEFLFD